MRYTTQYPVDFESDEAGSEPMEPTTDTAVQADDAPAADDASVEPVADGDGPEEPDASAEPPLWTTADGHLVHLPPTVVDRIVVRRPPPGPRPRRPGRWPLDERLRRRRAITTIGRLVRRARLSPRAGVGASRLPVFRGGLGRRTFGFVTRPRGLRHEITAIDPELMSESLLQELETPAAPAEPITTTVPFAPLPSSTCYWPVQTSHPEARVVSYLTATNKTIGRAGRRFMANRTGTRNGVPTPRNHCGVDLFARRGDPVVACEDGVVRKFGFFYKAKSGQDTCQLLIEHAGCVVNYGELAPDSAKRSGIVVGARVRAGQVVGYVSDTDMLHFETYVRGTTTSHRWWKGTSAPAALLNPTRYLLHLKAHGLTGRAPSITPSAVPSGTPQGIANVVQKIREQALIMQAINGGQRDPGTLATLVFYARHPERNRRPLQKGEPNFDRLAAEWLDIRDRLVKPIVAGTRAPATRAGSSVANELAPAPGSSSTGDGPRTPLGTLTVTMPGRTPFRYRFTPDDAIWTARLVQGEAGGDDSLKNVAVVWALVNRYGLFHKELGDKTFAAFIRRYSTVLQPHLRSPNAIARAMDTSRRSPGNPALKWVEVAPGTFVVDGKTYPTGQYQKHLTLQRTPWSGLRSGARSVAERVLSGQTPSPIGLASDFDGPHIFLAAQLRKAGKNLSAIRKSSPDEYRRLWLAFIAQHAKKKGKPWIGEASPKLEQMTSNAFYVHPRTRSLPADTVRIVRP